MLYSTKVRENLYNADYAVHEGLWYRIDELTMDDTVILYTGNDPLYLSIDEIEAVLVGATPDDLRRVVCSTQDA
jgi:hypothetical protein